MTKNQIAQQLINRYKTGNTKSSFNSEIQNQFIAMFYSAVKEFLQEFIFDKHKGQNIYGISFEIGTLFQSVYEEDFETYLYFNTEHDYNKQIKDCGEDEKLYYRFEPYAEWNVVNANTKAFMELQSFLMKNTLCNCTKYELYESLIGKKAYEWFDENFYEFEENFNKERASFRYLITYVLGILRKEGFWKLLGLEKLYVIPFSSEDEIPLEELFGSYLIIDQNCHANETAYLDYLNSLSEEPVDRKKVIDYFNDLQSNLK